MQPLEDEGSIVVEEKKDGIAYLLLPSSALDVLCESGISETSSARSRSLECCEM